MPLLWWKILVISVIDCRKNTIFALKKLNFEVFAWKISILIECRDVLSSGEARA